MKGFVEVQTKVYYSDQNRWAISDELEMINVSSISRFGNFWITLKEFAYDQPITIHVNHSYKELKELIKKATEL